MDIVDLEIGLSPEHAWFQSRLKLLETLSIPFFPKEGKRILVIGAGWGEEFKIWKNWKDVLVTDKSSKAILSPLIPHHFSRIQADALNLPFRDNYFHLLIAMDVLEHIKEDKKAFEEFVRVLKPGGLMIITVPAFPFLYSSHDRKLGHYRRYTLSTLPHSKGGKWIKKGFFGFSIFLPLIIYRISRKTQPPAKLKYLSLPTWINNLLKIPLLLEAKIIKWGDFFPFGASIYAIYRKEN